MRRKALKAAFPCTIPIMTGFIFLGASYGIYTNASGFSFVYPLFMSMLIYGGSLEFVAVEMLLSPFAPLQVFSYNYGAGKIRRTRAALKFAFLLSCGIMVIANLQGVTRMKESVFIILLRQVFLLVPLAWILHFLGLNAVWWTFPLTKIIASLWCVVLVTVKDKTPKNS